MMSEIHYIFRDGQTYAIKEGKVIAAGEDPDEVERQVHHAFGPDQLGEGIGGPTGIPQEAPLAMGGHHPPCEMCGGEVDPHHGTCTNCGARPGEYYGLDHNLASVVTPNGLKGTVLGKTASIWGEEVTIRLENGRIVRLPVGTQLKQPKTASKRDPIKALEERLSRTPDGTRESLVARHEELESIKRYAGSMVRDGASWDDSQRLDQIVVTADVEQAEIVEAVEHIDDAESYAPPGFSMGVADEAAGISREDASWLDRTVDEMIAEAEATDFNKLMDEGPEALTAELADSAVADASVTHGIASSFILEKTAGIDRKIAEPYINTFLSRVEHCRVDELTRRAKEVPNQKEAAAEDPFKDVPDDAVFL